MTRRDEPRSALTRIGDALTDASRGLAHVVRDLRRAPLHTAFAVGALAIGVAATTASFSVVNTFYYRALPYPDADRIVALSSVSDEGLHAWSAQPIEVVHRVRSRATAFTRVAAFEEKSALLEGPDGLVRISRTAIDTSVMRLIGATLGAGRFPSAQEIQTNAPVALISDSLWRSQFGGQPAVGRWIALDNGRYQVIGVLAPGVRFYRRSDVMIPLDETVGGGSLAQRRTVGLLARLKPGVTLANARADVQHVGAELARDDPRFARWKFLVEGDMFDRGAPQAEALAWLVTVMAAGVLLVACASVASLQMVRVAGRLGDTAVRAALGATRARLFAAHILEGTVLCAAAGLVGVGLAAACIKLLLGTVALNLPSWVRFGIDAHVAAFAVLVTFVSILGVSFWPAVAALRIDAATILRGAAATIVSPRRVLVRGERAIVIQVATSVALGICAVAVWQSHSRLVHADLGYDAANVRITHITWVEDAQQPQTPVQAYESALRLTDLTDAVVSARWSLPTARRSSASLLTVDARRSDTTGSGADTESGALYTGASGTIPADHDVRRPVQRYAVSDSYFATVGVRMLSGSGFDGHHQAGSAPVAIVSQSLAHRVWQDTNPIGRELRIGPDGTPATVIGVAADTWTFAHGPTGPQRIPNLTVYFSERQAVGANPSLLVRTESEAEALSVARAIETEALARGMRLSAAGSARLQDEAIGGYGDLPVLSLFLAAMSGVGILLVMLGLYALAANTVAARTREIGLRVALGSSTAGVVNHVAAGGMRATAGGVVIGMAVAAGLTYGL